jgi:hypothetical protein
MGSFGTLRSFLATLAPIVGMIGWVTVAGLSARAIPTIFPFHPRFGEFAVYGIAALGGIGGLVGFWYSAASVEFFVRGYRVRRKGTRWWYEERSSTGTIRRLPFGYKALAAIYRPPCEVCLPSQARWDDETPDWAHGRRCEIIENIKRDLGADLGTRVEFVDSTGFHEGAAPR